MYQYTEINAERFPHKVALCQRVLFLQGRVGDGGPRCRFRSQHSKRERQRLRFRKTQRRWCNRVFTVWAPWQRECSNLTRILEEKWTDDWRPISSDPDDCNSMMWNLFVGTMDWRNYTSVNSFHHLYKHTQGSDAAVKTFTARFQRDHLPTPPLFSCGGFCYSCGLKSRYTSPVTGVFDHRSHAFLISDSLQSEHMPNTTCRTAEISSLTSWSVLRSSNLNRFQPPLLVLV